ncbi:MAG: dethiobiotin synthase [Sandaracinaceae bacterium]
MHFFITGTGTGVGKTYFTCALAGAAVREGLRCAAVKPMETGCEPDALDAMALAHACGHPELAAHPGVYRARQPLAPHAATLMGEPALELEEVVQATQAAIADADLGLVEGAGGILVPLDPERTIADMILLLAMPILLVARDGLGVLSSTLTAVEAAERRGIDVTAVVLSQHGEQDLSQKTNAAILEQRLRCPVWTFSDDASAILSRLYSNAASPVMS